MGVPVRVGPCNIALGVIGIQAVEVPVTVGGPNTAASVAVGVAVTVEPSDMAIEAVEVAVTGDAKFSTLIMEINVTKIINKRNATKGSARVNVFFRRPKFDIRSAIDKTISLAGHASTTPNTTAKLAV